MSEIYDKYDIYLYYREIFVFHQKCIDCGACGYMEIEKHLVDDDYWLFQY